MREAWGGECSIPVGVSGGSRQNFDRVLSQKTLTKNVIFADIHSNLEILTRSVILGNLVETRQGMVHISTHFFLRYTRTSPFTFNSSLILSFSSSPPPHFFWLLAHAILLAICPCCLFARMSGALFALWSLHIPLFHLLTLWGFWPQSLFTHSKKIF